VITTSHTQPVQSWGHRTVLAIGLVLIALIIAAVVLFAILPKYTQVVAPEYGLGFADGYELIANNLIHGHGYRLDANASETMMREPGYPLFLAVLFKLAGYSLTSVRWANWLLTCGIAFLLMHLANRLTGDRTVALVATLLFLLYPSTLISEARGGVEILFILVLLVFMVSLHYAVGNGMLRNYFVAGLALGVVVQVRSTPLVFPFFLLIYLLLFGGQANERLKTTLRVAVLVLGMLVVMIPWIVRNYALVSHFVPTATVQGVAAQEGQYTCQHMAFGTDFYASQIQAGNMRDAVAVDDDLRFEGAYYQLFFDPHDEWAFNKILFQRVEKEYFDHPSLLADCACKNLFNFWFLGRTWQATKLNMLVQSPLLLLAVSGLYIVLKRGELARFGIILVFIFCIVAVHLPTIAHTRHSVPLLPFLAIPASVALVSFWRKLRGKTQSPTLSGAHLA
jgi:4-amino-4-deoxy-L-arabinose transferase-like glycosyltransferase